MNVTTVRKERLERLVALARAYRGWNLSELAEAIGRDPKRAIPMSGNPKLDLVARLAGALDWEVGEVASSLLDGTEEAPSDAGEEESRRVPAFEELDRQAQIAHRAGDCALMERIALALRGAARTPRERAIAANRLAGAYDGLGRYPRVLECVRAGLAEGPIGPDVRLMLTVNLANASYTLWSLEEARAVSGSIVDRFAITPPSGRLERVAEAFSRAIRGHALRRMVAQREDPEEIQAMARASIEDLSAAAERYDALAAEFDDPQYAGLANTARGGLIEMRAADGSLGADEALGTIVEALDAAVDVEEPASPHLLESWGWWSTFGANVALRATDRRSAEPEIDRTIAICTNKASEIAEELDHWPMRERAFSLEWLRRQSLVGATCEPRPDWMLDTDDVRVLVGTMGRFPLFRETGWRILDSAVIADDV